MKLDEKYWNHKLITLIHYIKMDDEYAREILHQIARYAAEAQRERCFNVKFPCQQEGCTDCLNTLAIPDGE